MYHPLAEPYISLYTRPSRATEVPPSQPADSHASAPSSENGKTDASEAEMSTVSKAYALRAQKPALWAEIETAMQQGTLQAMRDRTPATPAAPIKISARQPRRLKQVKGQAREPNFHQDSAKSKDRRHGSGEPTAGRQGGGNRGGEKDGRQEEQTSARGEKSRTGTGRSKSRGKDGKGKEAPAPMPESTLEYASDGGFFED